MPFSNVHLPEHLNLLTKVLDDHCREKAIFDARDREVIARRLINLFENGVTSDIELHAALASPVQHGPPQPD